MDPETYIRECQISKACTRRELAQSPEAVAEVLPVKVRQNSILASLLEEAGGAIAPPRCRPGDRFLVANDHGDRYRFTVLQFFRSETRGATMTLLSQQYLHYDGKRGALVPINFRQVRIVWTQPEPEAGKTKVDRSSAGASFACKTKVGGYSGVARSKERSFEAGTTLQACH